MEANAVVAIGPSMVAFQSIEVPDPTNEDVVIHVQHSWISNGTEGSFIRGERIGGDTPRSEGDPLPFPHVPGYQKVGVVEWVGKDVKDICVGDIVFGTISRVNGMFYPTGGHVSPAVTHYSQVWRLPAEVAPITVSGLVLVQVGYNCGMRPEIHPGDSVAVIGDSLVGHWAAQTLAYRGAHIMLVGKHDWRLAKFEARNNDRLVNINREDPVEVAREWAPSGIQAVVDTVGSVASLEAFYPVIRHGGHIVSAGFHGNKGLIDIQKMRDRELTLYAPSGWTGKRIDATLELVVRQAIKTEPLITHRFPVEKADEAFDVILSRREPFLGIILEWT